MMSTILRDDEEISSIVDTTWPTTRPPSAAAAVALLAICVAARAVSAFCLTVAVSSSIDAAVCCRLLACSSVRWLRSVLPAAIWLDPVAMESELLRTRETMLTRLSFMRRSARSSWLTSSTPVATMVEVRLPSATDSATFTALSSGRTIERVMTKAIRAPTSTAAASKPMTARRALE